MKKTLKKLSKILAILIIILLIELPFVTNFVKAVAINESKNIYQIDYCDKVLKYKGTPRGAAYVVYEQNGKTYPAYCVNPQRIGVGETDSYNVTVQGYITDVMLWKIITNGYPYKTVEELQVANEKEAYLATKQAIYCLLDNRNVYEYSGIGEAGQRTLNALRKIWENAQNCTETKISNIVDIMPSSIEWKQDEINSQYVCKTYSIKTPAPITEFNVAIKGQNLPEGLIITDINNNVKTNFKQNENFKILIPTNVLKNNGSFEIDVKTQMLTKPVLYGAVSNDNLQNYALTTEIYEDSSGTYYEQYQKNEAQIKILKQEKETKLPMQGVEFELLDYNKSPIYQSLITDENGEITLKEINPGIYYLKEVKTLPEYILYDELIEIQIHLNETVNVIINNSKEKNIEISKKVTNIEVQNSEINIQKLPKTGM